MNDSEYTFLENQKKKLVKDIIKVLSNTYQIYDKNDNYISSEILYKKLLEQKIVKRCVGITNSSPVAQCSKNAIENHDYCKSHMYKECLKSIKDENEDDVKDNINIIIKSNGSNGSNGSNRSNERGLSKIFIEDSFYFIDQKFVYDLDMNKAGIVNYGYFILTSDPFILETL